MVSAKHLPLPEMLTASGKATLKPSGHPTQRYGFVVSVIPTDSLSMTLGYSSAGMPVSAVFG